MSANKFYCARIYVTHKCNSNCIFCDTHDKKYHGIGDMNLEIAKSLIRQLKDVGCQYIDFTGGEPTLNKNLPDMIDFAKELGIKTEVTTNATSGLTETLRSCATKARKLNISLDTLNPECYKILRGVDKLDIVLDTIKKIVKIRAETGLTVPKLMTVVTGKNIEDLMELTNFAADNRLEIYLNPMFSYGHIKFSAEEKLFDKLISYTFEPHVIIPIHFLEFLHDLRNTGRALCRCGASENILTFAANGQIMMPCYHAKERQNIPWTNLSKFISGDEFQKYATQRGNLTSCTQCSVTPYLGIAFSYHPNKYFYLQSFADRLEHVKRDLLNHLPHYEPPSKLLYLLKELLTVTRSLPFQDQDCPTTDCWQISEYMPHQFFDKIYSKSLSYLRPEFNNEAETIANIPEFMLKLWIEYIRRKISPKHTPDVPDDINWIKHYLTTLGRFNSSI